MEETSNVANTKVEYSPGLKDDMTCSQEKLKQRREARRRKILDNAKSRMEKLGVRNANFKSPDDSLNGVFEYSDPEVEPNEVRFPYNNILGDISNPHPSREYDPFLDVKPAKGSFVFKYRLHVLVSITITYILALFDLMGGGKYGILFPTCISMALEVLLRKQKPVNPITALLVTIFKLPAGPANRMFRLLEILYDLVIDLGLTIFCIVTFTLINDCFRGSNLSTLQ